MYFAYGWPRVLDLSETGGIDTNGPLSSTEAVPGPALDRVVQLLGDDTLLVIITAGGIQLWSGGQHRVRLGGTARGVGAVRAEGAYKRAFWSSTRRLLAVVVCPPAYIGFRPGMGCPDSSLLAFCPAADLMESKIMHAAPSTAHSSVLKSVQHHVVLVRLV